MPVRAMLGVGRWEKHTSLSPPAWPDYTPPTWSDVTQHHRERVWVSFWPTRVWGISIILQQMNPDSTASDMKRFLSPRSTHCYSPAACSEAELCNSEHRELQAWVHILLFPALFYQSRPPPLLLLYISDRKVCNRFFKTHKMTVHLHTLALHNQASKSGKYPFLHYSELGVQKYPLAESAAQQVGRRCAK